MGDSKKTIVGYPIFDVSNFFIETPIRIDNYEKLGIKPQNIRCFMFDETKFNVENYKYLFSEKENLSDVEETYNYLLIKIYLVLGFLNDVKYGKNKYLNQSNKLMITYQYERKNNQDIRIILDDFMNSMKTEFKNIIKKLADGKIDPTDIQNEELKFKEQKDRHNNKFTKAFINAIYDSTGDALITPSGYMQYKNEIINRYRDYAIELFFKYPDPTRKTSEKIRKELKELFTYEHSNAVRTEGVKYILESINKIVKEVSFTEKEDGNVIFPDAFDKFPNFNQLIAEHLKSLRKELLPFKSSKKRGLKAKIAEWLKILASFESNEDQYPKAVIWIYNTFNDKTLVMSLIVNEGKYWYNQLASLFCKEALKKMRMRHNFNKFESRLFIFLNMAHKFSGFNILAREHVFKNFKLASKHGFELFLVTYIYEKHIHLKKLLLDKMEVELSKYSIWKDTSRTSDKEKKQTRRKEEGEENDPSIDTPKEFATDLDYNKFYQILEKHGKPIHIKLLKHFEEYKYFKHFEIENRPCSRAYICRLKKEMINILKKQLAHKKK
jgi:hypothetical protein